MRLLLAAALLTLLGCGRSGGIAESDLARLRPEWTRGDVLNAFGEPKMEKLNVFIYPGFDSDDEYMFCFHGSTNSLLKILKRNGPHDPVQVWPP